MKFNEWSLQRIKDYSKSLTSRKTKHEGDPMVRNIVGPLPWWFIKFYLYRDEGASSPDELQRVMNQLQRHEVEDNEMFYVHEISRHAVLDAERATHMKLVVAMEEET